MRPKYDSGSLDGQERLGSVDSSEREVVAIRVDEQLDIIDWTPEEEREVTRKIDFIILPMLGLAFFCLQMDRGNISNALTSTILEDLNLNTNQINVGNSVLFAGIVLLEIPSNILLQHVGPHKWLSGQVIAWGLVALFQNFITDYVGYITTRLILGLCEAGFIPGALYTMSTWYKKEETSLRVSIFFVGNVLAVALTSLIGSAILTISDRNGIAGWRWLFIVEGTITVGVGLLFAIFFPPSVGDGRPLISSGGGWSYFSERESHILRQRVILDDPSKAPGQKMRIHGHDIWATLCNPRVMIHQLITLAATIPVTAINTYGPTVIKSLGYSTVRANAMASVGPFIGVFLAVGLGWLCDVTSRRSPAAMFGALWALIAFICLKQSAGWSKGRRYAAVVFSMAPNSTVHIMNVGWLSLNCRSPQERSVAMAFIIIAANLAGLAGSQVFRDQDKPLYPHAFTACMALAAVTIFVIISQAAWYHASNKRLEESDAAPIPASRTDENSSGSEIEFIKKWYWTW